MKMLLSNVEEISFNLPNRILQEMKGIPIAANPNQEYILIWAFSKDGSDDAENNTTSESHVPRTIANGTYTTKRNNLAESTGVVPAKHPPKVKLELFSLL